ncbi:hypothetical protein [Terrarubrum flagellatum]|uniref:hypothetical protein n=1 Tax=Terrirubrum flagellatum TaxID=2895980 RepID=UPI0031450021
MKLVATLTALATLTVAAPAFAEGENPIQNAVKDHQMMRTGRYELPGARSYARAMGQSYRYERPAYGYDGAGYYGSSRYYSAPVTVYRSYPGDYYGDSYPTYEYMD